MKVRKKIQAGKTGRKSGVGGSDGGLASWGAWKEVGDGASEDGEDPRCCRVGGHGATGSCLTPSKWHCGSSYPLAIGLSHLRGSPYHHCPDGARSQEVLPGVPSQL